MKIAIDAMGGDHAPNEVIKGAIDALCEWKDIHIILVGPIERVKPLVPDYLLDKVTIQPADGVIGMDEEPVQAIRRKKDSSMVVAVNLVKKGEADAVISAGNTGAYMASGLLHVGRIEGIERPALAPVFPTMDNRGTLVLDVGANMDAKPSHLQQYAVMGTIYAREVLGIKNPRVGLLNVGTEEKKGNSLVKEAFGLISNTSNLHFIGNVEARDIPYGICDILVCDGFTGNVVLKLTEGVSSAIFATLKEEFMKTPWSKLAALILRPGLRRFKQQMDYKEHGGAPLLGLKGVVIKAHGSSDGRAFKNAIRQARQFVIHDVVGQITKHVKGVSES
ncbi:phosphate acyltransferase PlsX [Microaerobacter geothermalis]|uniref:phosphate acyltransferase PlsX n=1 Tax=Microaerobacter geothermalis TaxID=674972 RepID=UPI001F2F2E78|nr:phosphate acyltransferase PlsX [Microaerobacter geothermalis]MCF6095036.1 phosphate acyltransferase PlsX [Microaerobacter geothermalis]